MQALIRYPRNSWLVAPLLLVAAVTPCKAAAAKGNHLFLRLRYDRSALRYERPTAELSKGAKRITNIVQAAFRRVARRLQRGQQIGVRSQSPMLPTEAFPNSAVASDSSAIVAETVLIPEGENAPVASMFEKDGETIQTLGATCVSKLRAFGAKKCCNLHLAFR